MDNRSANTAIIENTSVLFRNKNSNEPDWLYAMRKASWDFYLESPMPNRTSNVWRYSDPKEFQLAAPEELMEMLPILPDDSARELRMVKPEYAAFGYNRGDHRTYAHLSPELEKAGVIFKDLFSAAREDIKARENLGKLIGADFGKFEAFNLALWNTGLYLHIPDNTVIEKPIYFHRHPTGMATIPRLLIVLGDNVQATLIDDYSCHCEHEGAILNGAVEIVAGASSNVRYINLQRLSPAAKTYITIRSRIGRATEMKSIFGSTGSLATKVNAGTILEGRGANSQMYGVIFGDGKQHFDYHTTHHHTSKESFSNLNFKVVLKDKAKSAYTGLIRIEKDAANCEAYQENRNLLLNKGTKAESIPELEILTDQVRCTHGATMGPIDPEMIFYLKSRGISENEAVKSVVMGYIEPLLSQIPHTSAEILRELTRAKMEESKNDDRIHSGLRR